MRTLFTLLLMACSTLHAVSLHSQSPSLQENFTKSPLYQQIVQLRLDYYTDAKKTPLPQTISNLFQQVSSISNIQERNLLTSYLLIIAVELSVYHTHQHKEWIISLYDKHIKESRTLRNPQNILYAGELSLLMIKINPRKKVQYFMTARRLFLQYLKKDPKNAPIRLLMGLWWVLDVFNDIHLESNHSIAQAKKYLKNSDDLLKISDPWNKIILYNLYYAKMLMELKILNTPSAQSYYRKLTELYPNSMMTKTASENYQNRKIKW